MFAEAMDVEIMQLEETIMMMSFVLLVQKH